MIGTNKQSFLHLALSKQHVARKIPFLDNLQCFKKYHFCPGGGGT